MGFVLARVAPAHSTILPATEVDASDKNEDIRNPSTARTCLLRSQRNVARVAERLGVVPPRAARSVTNGGLGEKAERSAKDRAIFRAIRRPR